MKALVRNAVLCLVGLLATSVAVAGDTNAPNRQTFTMTCGGATVTVVSPVEPARAAQVVGTTGVGILQRVTMGGAVLFEQPSFQAHDPAALTTCTFPVPGGELTFDVLTTPQSGRRP